MTPARFPHSDTPGSTLGCQLPRAYRRLLRPSSALDAKASTTCPSQLVTHTTNPDQQETTDDQQETADPGRRCTHMTRHKETNTPPHNQRGHANTTKQTDTTPHNHNRSREACLDARVHYPDLKQQPHTTPPRTQRGRHGQGTGPARSPDTPHGTPDPSEPQQCVVDSATPTGNGTRSVSTSPNSTPPPHQHARHSAGQG